VLRATKTGVLISDLVMAPSHSFFMKPTSEQRS